MKKKEKTPFVNFILFVMFCTLLFLGMKINEKKQWFELPAIQSWMPYEKWFHFYDNTVSGSIEYHHLIDDVYTNGTNICASLFDGIVLEIQEDRLRVLHDNGVEIIYGKLNDVLVKTDERILKGQTIASFEDSLTLNIRKDNQKVTLEEALKL